MSYLYLVEAIVERKKKNHTCARLAVFPILSLRLLASLHGVRRGRIRFLGSAFANARWTSSSSTSTIRMSIFSLLFVLASFLLLALNAVTLSQIVVLVLIHISVIHVFGIFLFVGINLYIAKLLLFPTHNSSNARALFF